MSMCVHMLSFLFVFLVALCTERAAVRNLNFALPESPKKKQHNKVSSGDTTKCTAGAITSAKRLHLNSVPAAHIAAKISNISRRLSINLEIGQNKNCE